MARSVQAVRRGLLGLTCVAITIFSCRTLAMAAEQDQRALLDLVVNQIDKGQALATVRGADVWIAVITLEDADVHRFTGDREVIDGVESVRLGSLAPGVVFSLNERELTLRIVARPEFLSIKRLNLQPPRPTGLSYGRNASAFINYALNWDRSAGYGAFADLGVRLGPALVATTLVGGRRRPLVRGQTSVTFDDRDSLRRWIVGDAFANTGLLGGGTFLAGVTVSREYGLDPYFLRFPTLDMSGAVMNPSTLEVYVNDRLVRREEVPPGRFDVTSLPVANGHGVARLVLRDAFGREQELASSFYLTTGVLASGLQEYNYHLGYQRADGSDVSWAYTTPVFMGRHRVGVTNSLTAGFRAELTTRMVSAGPTLNLRLPIGEVELAGAVSGEESQHGFAGAGSIGYAFASRTVSLGATARLMSARYATVSLRPGDVRTRFEASIYSSLPLGPRASVTVRQTVIDRQDQPRSSVSSVQGSVGASRMTNLYLSATNDWADRRIGATLSAGVGFFLGGRTSANLAQDVHGGSTRTTVDLQQSLPNGTGYGYRLSGDVAGGNGNGSLQYQGPYGRYEVLDDLADGRHVLSVRAAGGVVAIGGGVYATRAVQDGFALIRVPDVPGVRVYASNQEIGRTDRHGNLLVPGLLPYYGNRLAIADQDIPLDHTVGETEGTIAPPYRGGTLLTFPVRRFQNQMGRVVLQRGVGSIVPAYGQLTVRAGGRTFESPIGKDGEFYLENVPAGRHQTEVLYEQRICQFTVEIAPLTGPTFDLGLLRCVEKEQP